MSLSHDRMAYEKEFTIFDKALESRFGVRYPVETYGHGVNLRQRMNRARQLDRELNSAACGNDRNHPSYGKTRYAHFRIGLEEDDGQWWVTLKPNVVNESLIEELPPPDGWIDESLETLEADDEREGAS